MAKLEKVEEGKFVLKVESHGWVCFKLRNDGPYGKNGFNDRLVLAENSVSALFEFKREGEGAEALQDFRHRCLKKLGHNTYVVYTCEEAYRILLDLVKQARDSR